MSSQAHDALEYIDPDYLMECRGDIEIKVHYKEYLYIEDCKKPCICAASHVWKIGQEVTV